MSPLLGIYSGNPASPKLPEDGLKASREAFFQPRLGYLGDFIHSTPLTQGIDSVSSFQMIVLGGVFLQRIQIALTGGSVNVNFYFPKHSLQNVRTGTSPTYGGRIQTILVSTKHALLGLSLSGLRASGGLRDKNFSWRLNAAQMGLSVGSSIGSLLSPYLGGQISSFSGKVGKIPYHIERNFCGLAGCAITAHAIFSMNIEARFIGEEGISLEAYFAF